MAVSPRKLTKRRKRMRRSHHAIKNVNISFCKNCNSVKHSHIMCPNCGFYAGKQVIEVAG